MSRFRSLAFVRIFGIVAFHPVFAGDRDACKKIAGICIPLVAVLVLSGCASIQVRLGMKVHLEKIPITSMQASMPKGPGIAPGEKSPLVVTFAEQDGKVLITEGQGHGKVLWKDLVVAPIVVSARKGTVSLPEDPRISDGKVAHVTITVPSHPDLHAELDIPVRYDRNFSANFYGSSGSNGSSGSSGTDGFSGSSGSTDPDHPSPGGNGSDGGRGSDGQDGEDGSDGPSVAVRVALRSGSHPLIQVSVYADRHETFYLVDPQGGSLTVKTEGGSGGSGGKGGAGGRGGAGGSGSPDGASGHDGASGMDGRDGSPGKGGSIIVTYDPQVTPFLRTVRLFNPGGPRPVFRQEPVAPLW
jgi:uncharacterized membrane protein YgcG